MAKGILSKKALRLDSSTRSRNRHVPPVQRHQYMQDRLNATIKDPSFQFDFPELSSAGFLRPRDDRVMIYETIGDGILHGVVATEMYKHNPFVTRQYMVVCDLTLVQSALHGSLFEKPHTGCSWGY